MHYLSDWLLIWRKKKERENWECSEQVNKCVKEMDGEGDNMRGEECKLILNKVGVMDGGGVVEGKHWGNKERGQRGAMRT